MLGNIRIILINILTKKKACAIMYPYCHPPFLRLCAVVLRTLKRE